MTIKNADDQTQTWQNMGVLANSLKQIDQERAFDRCLVGGPTCEQTPIQAHAIPRTVLRLIADADNEVVSTNAVPPTHIPTYFTIPNLKNCNINQFSISKWACQKHDEMFANIDSQNIDFSNPYHIFLLIYRTTLRAFQAALQISYRISMLSIDPAHPKPVEIGEQLIQNLQGIAVDMTISTVKLMAIKAELDKILSSGEYDALEYRVASWKITPTMAACGMKWFEGEKRDPDMVAKETEAFGYPADPNMIIPGWMIVLPQQHGQTVLTASTIRKDKYTATLHEGMPKTLKMSNARGRNWTNSMSRRAITMAFDLAVSKDKYAQLDDNQRNHIQKYLKIRSSREVSEKNLPNLFDY